LLFVVYEFWLLFSIISISFNHSLLFVVCEFWLLFSIIVFI